MAQAEFLDLPMPDIIAQWRFYLSVLAPGSGDVLIDVGCNTGDAERLLVRDYPDIAKVIGIEKEHERYARAITRCQAEGTPGQIEFRCADGQELPFDDCTFDKALCVDTLEWIEDPLQALRELRRVLKPDGTALVVHSDFDTQVFNAADQELCRRVIHRFTDSGPNGQIGRQLYALCQDSGFSAVDPSVYVLINCAFDPRSYAHRAAIMMAEWLSDDSRITADELARWMADLETQNSQGQFFYSINRYLCRCRK